MFHTEIAKITKQWTNHGSEGVIQSKSVFVTFCDLCVENSVQKRRSTQRSQRSQSNGRTNGSERLIQSKSVFVTFAISVWKIPFRKATDALRIEGAHNPIGFHVLCDLRV
jgi:hypothetical protein